VRLDCGVGAAARRDRMANTQPDCVIGGEMRDTGRWTRGARTRTSPVSIRNEN
jgi:hypothetical protein